MASVAEKDSARPETHLQHARRIGCVHPYYLSFAGKCAGCRKLPLSGESFPDHYSRALYEAREDDPPAA